MLLASGLEKDRRGSFASKVGDGIIAPVETGFVVGTLAYCGLDGWFGASFPHNCFRDFPEWRPLLLENYDEGAFVISNAA